MENNFLHNNEVDFWYGIYLYEFYLVNFHFALVSIVVDHDNLLNLKLFAVYFDFVKRSFECLF